MKSATSTNRTLVLVNPQARNGHLGEEWTQKEKQVFEALGEKSAQVAFTTAADHGSGLVRQALRAGVERIVVVGGDGTLSEAIQGFFAEPSVSGDDRPINPDAVLMMMPAGRGDDFFKTVIRHKFYSSSVAWSQGLELLKHGKPHPVDVGRIRWMGTQDLKQRYFINITSFGFTAQVVERVHSRYGILGKSFLGRSGLTYGLQWVTALKSYKPIHIHVSVDGHKFYHGPIHSGFVLNGQYNGGGICWEPNAQIDDGQLHLMLIEPRNTFNTLKDYSRIILGQGDQIPGVHRGKGQKIDIRFDDGHVKTHPFFEVDGDLLENSETRGASIDTLVGMIKLQYLERNK